MVTGPNGRIRITEEQFRVLDVVLAEARHREMIRRADARDQGKDLWAFQRRIKAMTEMQDELERTAIDMDWSHEQFDTDP
jgi:hypothetical protein